MALGQNLTCVVVAHSRESFLRWARDPGCILERNQAVQIFILSPLTTREDPVHFQEGLLNVENQPLANLMLSRIAERENPVAIRRNPVKWVIVKNRSPAQKKILPAKKEKNPVPIKKRTVPRKSVKSNNFFFSVFRTLKFTS